MPGRAQAGAVILGLLAPVLVPMSAVADVTDARLINPTSRYVHGVLGKRQEWAAVEITDARGMVLTVNLPEHQVFEDYAPRLWDVDGDGDREMVTVLTDVNLGAALAVYDETGLVAATGHIGEPQRWLAPVGAGDLDGDGRIEIAYVDRPHMKKDLVFLRLEDGALRELGRVPGVTNHRIGWNYVAGGVRDCGDGAEAILFDAPMRQIVAVRIGDAEPRVLGHATWAALALTLECKPFPGL